MLGTVVANLYGSLAFPSTVALSRGGAGMMMYGSSNNNNTQHDTNRHRGVPVAVPVAALARIVGNVEALGGILITASSVHHDAREAEALAAALAEALSQKGVGGGGGRRTMGGRGRDAAPEGPVPVGSGSRARRRWRA
jgi:hypothetical protein